MLPRKVDTKEAQNKGKKERKNKLCLLRIVENSSRKIERGKKETTRVDFIINTVEKESKKIKTKPFTTRDSGSTQLGSIYFHIILIYMRHQVPSCKKVIVKETSIQRRK